MDPNTNTRFGNVLDDAGIGSLGQPATNLSAVQFENLNFSRVDWALLVSINWSRVKYLYVRECTELAVLFRSILFSTHHIGIQELVVENKSQRELFTPAHPHNIDNFLRFWWDLLTISISTCVA